MDEALELTSAVGTEIPVAMDYERTGKSRLFPAYLLGSIYNLLLGGGPRVHKSTQTNKRLRPAPHEQPRAVAGTPRREQ